MFKDVVAALTGQANALVDAARMKKPLQNARDAFAAEHMEIGAYNLLARLADEAGDTETADVARRMLADEERMAETIAGRWEVFVRLELTPEEARV